MSLALCPEQLEGRHQEMPLSELVRFPLLAEVYGLWRRSAEKGRPPPGLDPLEVPTRLLPYVMLLDLERLPRPRLRVRLAGTEVCTYYGGELRGSTTDDFFKAGDRAAVVEAALTVARSGVPSLACRRYVTLQRRRWTYTRLILPLCRGEGSEPDAFYKVLDPGSLRQAL